ncbi:MAG: hypothetical protein AAF542_22975 [Pseudomonadota bacterium]
MAQYADTLTLPVRMPRTLYDNIISAADQGAISRNKEVVQRLERSYKRDAILAEMLLEGLGVGKYQRITSTTAENDIRRLFLFLENIPVDRIYLAARKDIAFGAVMVILIQSGPLTLYMDHGQFNSSTDDGHELLMDLFSNIERLGLTSSISIAEDYVPDTRDMDAFEAIDCYLSQIPFRKRGNIKKLLSMLRK